MFTCERFSKRVCGIIAYLSERGRERKRALMERQLRFHCGGWFTSASLWAQRGWRPRLTSIRPEFFFHRLPEASTRKPWTDGIRLTTRLVTHINISFSIIDTPSCTCANHTYHRNINNIQRRDIFVTLVWHNSQIYPNHSSVSSLKVKYQFLNWHSIIMKSCKVVACYYVKH